MNNLRKSNRIQSEISKLLFTLFDNINRSLKPIQDKIKFGKYELKIECTTKDFDNYVKMLYELDKQEVMIIKDESKLIKFIRYKVAVKPYDKDSIITNLGEMDLIIFTTIPIEEK